MRHLTTRLAALALGLVLAAGPSGAPEASAQSKYGSTSATFLGIGVGARATAMGGAQAAEARGPSALFWNPAATAFSAQSAVELSHQEWFVDTGLDYAAASFNLGSIGTVGVSATRFGFTDEPVTTVDNPEGTGELFDATSFALGVSYSRALTEQFAFGATLKYVTESIWNESSQGLALDLGVLYDTGFRGIRIGATMANFGTDLRLAGPDLRRPIDNDPDQEGGNDRLPGDLDVDEWPMPLIFRVGISGEAARYGDTVVRLAVDGNAPSDDAQSASFGTEVAYNGLDDIGLYARGGYNQAFGSREAGFWTLGLGLQYTLNDQFSGHFDYVFQGHQTLGTPQMFTFGLTF